MGDASIKKKVKPGVIEVHPEDSAIVVNYEVSQCPMILWVLFQFQPVCRGGDYPASTHAEGHTHRAQTTQQTGLCVPNLTGPRGCNPS